MGNLARFALTFSAAALGAGCGGSQPPIGPQTQMPGAAVVAMHADDAGS